jgi:hypothetical protein
MSRKGQIMLPPAVLMTMPAIISQYWRGYWLYSALILFITWLPEGNAF